MTSAGAVVDSNAPVTWVLLRGLTREAGHWGDFGQRLAVRLGPRHQALTLDFPGNGVLYRQPSAVDVPAMTAACQAELQRLGARPPYVLVAMSLGAMAAVQWCHDAAHQLAGCVLINTSLRGHNPFWERLRPASYPALLRMLLPGLSPLGRESLILAVTSSDPQRHHLLPAQWARVAKQHPVTRINALRQLVAAARYAAPDRSPPVPLLMLASAGDRLVSPRCSQQFASRWGLRLKLHPSAGHDLPLDDPEWVLHEIAEWWSTTVTTDMTAP